MGSDYRNPGPVNKEYFPKDNKYKIWKNAHNINKIYILTNENI